MNHPAPNLVRKALALLVLTVLLRFPVELISGLISERNVTKEAATREVRRIAGGEQTISGPLLSISIVRDGPAPLLRQSVEPIDALAVLPEELSIQATAELSSRYRGIFEIPVYRLRLRLEGTFALAGEWDLPAGSRLELESSRLNVSVGDVRGILDDATLVWDGERHRFEAGSSSSYLPSGISVGGLPPEALSPGAHDFSIDLHLSGSGALRFLPAGGTTHVSVEGNWPDPSFIGAYLPIDRTVKESGFTATWRIPQLARPLPSAFFESRRDARLDQEMKETLFGVAFVTPVDVHRMASRAVKYDLLFVSLTFAAVLACEILFNLRLHVIQYGFLGAALTIFYLLLLSLSEKLGFGVAYLTACGLVTSLVVGYSSAVLGRAGRGRLIGALLGTLYLYLYALLREDDHSLLIGSLGLTAILAAVMYLTRSIDWYALTSRKAVDTPSNAVARGEAESKEEV